MAETACPSARPVIWPWFVAGLIGPLLAGVFARWIRYEVAFGIAFFLCFSSASMVIDRRSGVPIRVARAFVASFVGALAGGLIAFVFEHPFR